MLAPATIEQTLVTEEKSVVTPDELTVLPSRRRRRSALRAARKRWGRKVAGKLRQLHKEQLKLARMIADGEQHLANQRSQIMAVRRSYDASVDASQTTEGRSATRSSRWPDEAAKRRREAEGGSFWSGVGP